MAAYLNRTISLVTGQTGPNDNDKNSTTTDSVDDTHHNLSLQTSASSTSANYNAMADNSRMYQTNDKSPLQIFVRAKKKINDIYGEIEEYVLETTTFINGKEALYMLYVFPINLSLSLSLSSSCGCRDCGQGGARTVRELCL